MSLVTTSSNESNLPNRSFVFTWNNPTLSGIVLLSLFESEPLVKYVIFQLEEGSTTLTPHFQGVCFLVRPIRPRRFFSTFSTSIHFEARRGSVSQAISYCRKPEGHLDGPWEFGTPPPGQGSRSDMLRASELVRGPVGLLAIVNTFPGLFVRYHGGFLRMRNLSAPGRTQPPVVYLLHGPTGCGKTRLCWERFPALYARLPDCRFFDGISPYDKVLLLDDFSGANCKMSLSMLLQLLDRYPIRVEVKGSSCHMNATVILITTNIHPRQWYTYTDRMEHYAALERRIHHVIAFDDNLGFMVHCNKATFFALHTVCPDVLSINPICAVANAVAAAGPIYCL